MDKNYSQQKNVQHLSDILLYATHSDPQLRGTVRVLIASFIKAVLINSSGNYNMWVDKNAEVNNRDIFKIEQLMDIMVKVITVMLCCHNFIYVFSGT